MRRILLLATLALPSVLGCTKLLEKLHPGETADAQAAASASAAADSDAGQAPPQATAAPSATAAETATAHPHVAPVYHPEGPPGDAKPCEAGKDSTACTPDGFEELTCFKGHWKVVQTCRGPGHCVGEGASLACDVGTPQQGDACVANAEARCADAKTLLACKQGHWAASLCAPPASCQAAANGAAACAASPAPAPSASMGPLHPPIFVPHFGPR